MLKKLLTTAALVTICTHGASAEFVDWKNGTAVVTAASAACRQNGVKVGDAYSARYRHPNLGDNGDRARLSIFRRSTAHHFAQDGDFSTAFQTPNAAVFIGGGVVSGNSTPSYEPQIRMARRKPGIINETTKQIYLLFRITGFFVSSDVNNCTVTLEMTALR